MKQTNLQNKIRNKFIKQGVKMIAPETVFFSKDTTVGKNVTIEPYVVFGSKVKIKNNVKILAFSHLEGVSVDNNVSIGPYARLRPGTVLEEGSKVGNFVEIKKSRLKKNSKANHLTYIGDATIGKKSNIGAGTITCNYDGNKKHKTKLDENVFIGSNSSLVAPVKVGKKSYVAAGSVITSDVPPNSLAFGRSKQSTKKNWKKK